MKITWTPILILFISLVFLVACEDGGGSGVAVGEDKDWGDPYEWEEDLEPEVLEFERMEIPEELNRGITDRPYLQWFVKQWDYNDDDAPLGAMAIAPRVPSGAYLGGSFGLVVWDEESETFTSIEIADEGETPEFQVLHIVPDPTMASLQWVVTVDRLLMLQVGNPGRPDTLRVHCKDLAGTLRNVVFRGSEAFLATSSKLYEIKNTSGSTTQCVHEDLPFRESIIDVAANPNGSMAIMTFDNDMEQRHKRLWTYIGGHWADDPVLHTEGLLQNDIRKMQMSDDDKVLLITSVGVQVYDMRQDKLYLVRSGEDALPEVGLWDRAMDEEKTELYAGDFGIFRKEANASRWEVFTGPRWLPDDMVTAVGVSYEKTQHEASEQPKTVYPIFAATLSDISATANAGLAYLYQRDWKLKDKEAVFRANLEAFHRRLDAFIAPLDLPYSGSLEQAVPRIMARDGLWSGLYVLAEVSRYQAETDADLRTAAHDNAWNVVSRILEMEKATLDENPDGGYLPASFAAVEDVSGEGWHKGDAKAWLEGTDAASLVGWVMALALFHDEMADESQQNSIRALLKRIVIYLAANAWRYVVPGGDTPLEADFSETFLESDGYGPLRALQLLAVLRAAYSVTDDAFALEAYGDRAWSSGYAEKTTMQKTASDERRGDHAADLEAFMAFHLLLHYSDFAELRPTYEEALKTSWEIERNEQNPFFNFVAGAVFHDNVDAEAAVLTLQKWPIDLFDWNQGTCWRKDLTSMDLDWQGWAQVAEKLEEYERPLMRLDSNPYRCGFGAPEGSPEGGRVRDSGLSWYVSYWLGRSLGFIL